MKLITFVLLISCYTTLVVTSESTSECNTKIICGSSSDVRFRRHPTDCTKSFRCQNGEAKIYTCPQNQYFFADLQVCKTPDDTKCDVECFVPEIEPDQDIEIRPADPETFECVYSRCLEITGSQLVLLPHFDCNKYCVCHENTISTEECPPGLHFNFELKVCDWPVHAGCSNNA